MTSFRLNKKQHLAPIAAAQKFATQYSSSSSSGGTDAQKSVPQDTKNTKTRAQKYPFADVNTGRVGRIFYGKIPGIRARDLCSNSVLSTTKASANHE
jgi:hypothetical protein